jgi:hypothetical protein
LLTLTFLPAVIPVEACDAFAIFMPACLALSFAIHRGSVYVLDCAALLEPAGQQLRIIAAAASSSQAALFNPCLVVI